MRANRGAGAEGLFPAGLERGLEVVAHPGGGVGVEAAHAGDLVAEALFGEDLGDAVLGHPGLAASQGGDLWLFTRPGADVAGTVAGLPNARIMPIPQLPMIVTVPVPNFDQRVPAK